MALQIKNNKVIEAKSRSCEVARLSGNVFSVFSPTSSQTYTVRLHGNHGTCDCDWGMHRARGDKRSACKHVLAAINFVEQEAGRKVYAWVDEVQAIKQHRPMRNIGNGVILTSRLVA